MNSPGQSENVRRHAVINRLLSLYDDPRYLEVGVNEGVTFDNVTARRKVAVDPVFLFDHESSSRQVDGVEYHPVTSDDYFASLGDKTSFDVIYLDGLHTLEQTLRDLNNSLEVLQPQGIIVIDDTRPPSALAAIRDHADHLAERQRLGSNDKAWSGDVFRLVWFIDTFMPNLTYRTIANNHGQTVVWRQRRRNVTERLVSEIAALTWDDLDGNREVLREARMPRIRRRAASDLGLQF